MLYFVEDSEFNVTDDSKAFCKFGHEFAELAIMVRTKLRVPGMAKHAALATVGKGKGARRRAVFGVSLGHRDLLKKIEL